jgi:hypothetical protein
LRIEHKILVGIPEGKKYWEDLGIDGRILKWILKKYDGFICLRIETSDMLFWIR